MHSRACRGSNAEQAEPRSAREPPSLLGGRCPQLAADVMGVAPSAEQALWNVGRLTVTTTEVDSR